MINVTPPGFKGVAGPKHRLPRQPPARPPTSQQTGI